MWLSPAINDLAERINAAFVSVTQHLEPISSTLVTMQNSNGFSETPPELFISEIDVYHKLSAISTSKSSDPDCIRNWVLKSNSLTLALPIASILNASIQQSLVPSIWKKADVIPIQKVKNLNDINTDLRPISLTPTLAKICERFIADWLMEFITCIAIYGKCKSRIRLFFVSRSAEVRLRHKFTDWLQFWLITLSFLVII